MQNHISTTQNNKVDTGGQKVSFKRFTIGNKTHRNILWISTILILVQWGTFKYFYPYAGFIHGDSFNYLRSAYDNLDVNTYMIGYAKFLRLFSVFSSTDFALVTFQFLFIQAAGLFLLFTIFYFYRPIWFIKGILLVFFVLNPLFWYMANYVSSDAFFLALSLLWFACLLWVMHRPTTKTIVWHSAILFIAFTVRYNALIYPLIALLGFSLSPLPLRKKVYGLGLALSLVGLFVLYTSFRYKQITGHWQYAPFSGWQLANNALYAYRYVDSAERKPAPARLVHVDNMISHYFDTSRNVRTHPLEATKASTAYMWDTRRSPLYKYESLTFKKGTTVTEFKAWASMGPLYKSYGIYLIKQYPGKFLTYFVLPNALKYYAPPVEFLGAYNSNRDSTAKIGQTWFKFTTNKVTTNTKSRIVGLLNFYPILSGVINLVLLFFLIVYILLKGAYSTNIFRKGVFIGGTLWIINAGFTILASSAALRFQAFPVVLSFTYLTLLLGWLLEMLPNKKPNLITSKNVSNEISHFENAVG